MNSDEPIDIVRFLVVRSRKGKGQRHTSREKVDRAATASSTGMAGTEAIANTPVFSSAHLLGYEGRLSRY